MSSRPNTPYRPCLCSHDVSKTDMEQQAPDTWHQARCMPDTCFVSVTVRHRHLDFTISWCEDSGCFPPEVSETAAWNPMVRRSPKWWSTTTDWSDFTVPSLIPWMHLGIWACDSTWWRHTSKHGSSVPHQRITQPTPDCTWHCQPGRPRNKWLEQLWNSYGTISPIRMEISGSQTKPVAKHMTSNTTHRSVAADHCS